jgi:hypothetical protein
MQPGDLHLDAPTAGANAAGRIFVVDDGILPPGPPAGAPSGSPGGGDNSPDRYDLRQNYPNPFNPATRIAYDLPERALVRLRIVNILGQVVRVLADGERESGRHAVEWDGRSASGSRLASGVYFAWLEAISLSAPAARYTSTVKMLMQN